MSPNHNKNDLADPVSRLTAQASYNVISLPTAKQQLVALTIKNIKIRIRDLAQTMYVLFSVVQLLSFPCNLQKVV
jgi:hypothetical protein